MTVIFDGVREPKEISNQEIIDKIKYFVNTAKNIDALIDADKEQAQRLAKQLKDELKAESHANDLVKTAKKYRFKHDLFLDYIEVIGNAASKAMGHLKTEEQLSSFTYDVKDYLDSYLTPALKKLL